MRYLCVSLWERRSAFFNGDRLPVRLRLSFHLALRFVPFRFPGHWVYRWRDYVHLCAPSSRKPELILPDEACNCFVLHLVSAVADSAFQGRVETGSHFTTRPRPRLSHNHRHSDPLRRSRFLCITWLCCPQSPCRRHFHIERAAVSRIDLISTTTLFHKAD
jgi:hypothetical protein